MKTPRDDREPRPGRWQTGVSLLLLFVVLEIAVLCVEQARWITPQPALTLVLVLAMATGWLLAASRLPGLATHLIALAAGGGVTLWQARQAASPDLVPFAAFLVLMTWLMGYLSPWLLRRRQNAWAAVIFGAVVVVINLSNLPSSYFYYFGLYFGAAVLLITWTRLVRQRSLGGGAAVSSRRSLLQVGASLLAVIVVAVLLARAAPEIRTPQFQTMLAGGLHWIQGIEQSALNIFAPVPAKMPLNTSLGHRDVRFGELWFDNDRVDFVVESPQPRYWRIETYDTYTSQGWENRPASDLRLKADEVWDEAAAPAEGETITYTVTAGIGTDVLLTTGDFVAADTPVVVSVSDGDIVAVKTLRTLGSGESYSATASVTSPAPEALAAITGDYPEAIPNQYTRLPASFPDAVRQLAKDITQDAETPYQKVLAIGDYLSQFPYDETVAAPPEGADGVAYFLFENKAGFCLYYASAMVTMLRAAGVPSRLAVGYLPGQTGDDNTIFTLRNTYHHAWPQVYFPGYGWVDLEATPGGRGSRVPSATPGVVVGTPKNEGTLANLSPLEMTLGIYGPLSGLVPGGAIAPPAATGTTSLPMPDADAPGWGLYIALIIASLIGFIGLVAAVLWALRLAFRRWLWRVDEEAPATGIYDRLSRLAALAGLGPRPQQTPLEFAAVLAAEFPEQAPDLDVITRAYLSDRFGRKDRPPEPWQATQVLKARRGVYESLLKRLGAVRRIFGPRRR